MKEIKITNFWGSGQAVVSETENVSFVVDKMIRLAAKLTEHYASDIFYDISDLNNAVKEKKPLDNLLFFRENGVTTREIKDFDADTFESLLTCFTPNQTWRLTHDPATTETKLIRVDVRKVGLF